jgi:hypothetical protein
VMAQSTPRRSKNRRKNCVAWSKPRDGQTGSSAVSEWVWLMKPTTKRTSHIANTEVRLARGILKVVNKLISLPSTCQTT